MSYDWKNNPKTIFARQKGMAKYRNIDWHLSFDEWYDIWIQSGKWELRGRGEGKYCMSRKGDTGSYSINNVYINECVKNSGDKFRGTKQSPDIIAKRVKAITGVKHSPERCLANSLGQLRYRAKLKSMITIQSKGK
jgi:hypothetical protein